MTKQSYLFPVTETAIESWKRVRGAKQTFWMGILPLMLIGFAHTLALTYLGQNPTWSLLVCTPLLLIASLLGAGLIHMGIYRAKDLPIDFSSMLYAFHPRVMLHLFGLFILQTVIVAIPTACIGASLYLMTLGSAFAALGIALTIATTLSYVLIIIRMIFSVAFVMDHDEKPFAAVRKSVQITSGNFWPILGFFYMSVIIMVASGLTALIGFIWTIPFWYIWYGMSYTALSKNNQ